IAVLDTASASETTARIKSVARKTMIPEFKVSGVIHLTVLIDSISLKDLALFPDVLAIERVGKIRLLDERQDQIVAGAIAQQSVNNLTVSKPAAPGYLSFLQSAGISTDFDFTVDVADTGFDQGSDDPARMHPDFFNAAGVSRLAYLHDFTRDSHPSNPSILPAHDSIGHGTLTASIVGGFNNKSGDAFRDFLGFQYGLGVAPFARIGISKIFTDDGSFDASLAYIRDGYRIGARVSSNSWGVGCDVGECNRYDVYARAFDSFVRDADSEFPLNQEMTIVFAAGNDGDITNDGVGANSINSPGTAKNVITAGATKNFRATDSNGNSLKDSCNWPGSFADNALDILSISSGGFVRDGRTKPDIVAPGSHIVGAATQDSGSTGICGLGRDASFFPQGQQLYTWATGTSFATPAVAGGAALAFQWLKAARGFDPSPALVKALLLNSASYITGELANDNLPGIRQGWGLMNLERAFDQTERIIYDQDQSRTFTESGGAPFETTAVISDLSKELRVMLTWTDPPGNIATNAPYVNQLNLEVIAGGVVYNGNHFSGQYSTPGGQKDFLNNVQGVRLPPGTKGPFVVRVRPEIIAGDGVPGNSSPLDQDFALVVLNARETPLPVLTVEQAGDVSAGITVHHADGKIDASLIPGEVAKITVTIKNESHTTTASIQDSGLFLLVGTQGNGQFGASPFPTIGPGQTGANGSPFEISIPSQLRCGSVANLEVRLETTSGSFSLPVRVQVGRPTQPGGPEETLLFDDVDNRLVKWKMKAGFGPISGPANSGSMSFHTQDPDKEKNNSQLSQLFTKKGLNLPDNAGQIRLSFFHIFNFEPGYDGGVVELSTDEGGTWQDLGPMMLTGGYDGKVTAVSNNPLGSRFAFTAHGKPGVFNQVVVDLSNFAGKRIKLRFLGGFDEAAGVSDGYTGWFIDDIRITAVMYSCR
ncbi:MAG: S8 family serine peptidase, partial [Blastocatellia bacterium]